MQRHLYLAAALTLVVSLVAGAAIYFTAEDEAAAASAYLIVDGTAYPYDPTISKTYVRELQRFGGRAAVLFDEFNRWFTRLWRGKALGITIAWIGVSCAALLAWVARRW